MDRNWVPEGQEVNLTYTGSGSPMDTEQEVGYSWQEVVPIMTRKWVPVGQEVCPRRTKSESQVNRKWVSQTQEVHAVQFICPAPHPTLWCQLWASMTSRSPLVGRQSQQQANPVAEAEAWYSASVRSQPFFCTSIVSKDITRRAWPTKGQCGLYRQHRCSWAGTEWPPGDLRVSYSLWTNVTPEWPLCDLDHACYTGNTEDFVSGPEMAV